MEEENLLLGDWRQIRLLLNSKICLFKSVRLGPQRFVEKYEKLFKMSTDMLYLNDNQASRKCFYLKFKSHENLKAIFRSESQLHSLKIMINVRRQVADLSKRRGKI